MTDNNKTENARRALAVMTAWASDPDGQDRELLIGAVRDAVAEGETDMDGLTDLTLGFVNLCGLLLVHIAKETGVDEPETLRRLALQITD